MNEIVRYLEKIAKLAQKGGDSREIESVLELAREALKKTGDDPRIKNLDSELSTWQSKISVIFKELTGRQGMSRHCLHWVEKLKK